MAQLTVLTINSLGLPVPIPGLRSRLAALGAALAATPANVACLQEVGRWRHLPLLREDESTWRNAIAIEHPYAPKGGLVTLSKLPVLETRYHRFNERGRVASLHATERHQNKGVLRTTVAVAGQAVVVLNTHLAANYSANWSQTNPYAKAEQAQLREIAELVRAVPQETIVIVAGDFNVPRKSWLYDELRAATGLLDPLADSSEPTYRPLPGMPARAIQALDHILVRTPPDLVFTIQSELCFRDPVTLSQGREGFLSDHLGVKMTLSWQESQSQAHDVEVNTAQNIEVVGEDSYAV